MFRSFITIIYVLYCSQSICRFLLQYFKLFNDKETHFINQLNFEIKRLRFSHPFFPPTTVETLLECPQQSSKHQNKLKKYFLKSSQVSKVIKLPLSLPSEKNHVKMQVLKWVPPEHKQPKHRGLLPFPTDQICRQIQRKFLGDSSHHYQARHCTADNHSLLRAEEYTKHPPIRLNGQSNQSPSCSTTA